MERIGAFIRNNRTATALAAVLFLLGLVALPYVIGLNGAIGAGLALLVVAASAIIDRFRNRARPGAVHAEPGSRLLSAFLGLVVIGLLIQAVPLGWDQSNPAVTAEPQWDSARTRELTVRACFDCHSNEVVYPWYSRVAPMSWAVALHVAEGREAVNFSEWDRPQHEAEESAETVREGEMPPAYYTRFTHPEARLTDAELQELAAGLRATIGDED